jgi:hypothetical protein
MSVCLSNELARTVLQRSKADAEQLDIFVPRVMYVEVGEDRQLELCLVNPPAGDGPWVRQYTPGRGYWLWALHPECEPQDHAYDRDCKHYDTTYHYFKYVDEAQQSVGAIPFPRMPT